MECQREVLDKLIGHPVRIFFCIRMLRHATLSIIQFKIRKMLTTNRVHLSSNKVRSSWTSCFCDFASTALVSIMSRSYEVFEIQGWRMVGLAKWLAALPVRKFVIAGIWIRIRSRIFSIKFYAAGSSGWCCWKRRLTSLLNKLTSDLLFTIKSTKYLIIKNHFMCRKLLTGCRSYLVETDPVGPIISTTIGIRVTRTHIAAIGFCLFVLIIWSVTSARTLISPNQSIVIITSRRAVIKTS